MKMDYWLTRMMILIKSVVDLVEVIIKFLHLVPMEMEKRQAGASPEKKKVGETLAKAERGKKENAKGFVETKSKREERK